MSEQSGPRPEWFEWAIAQPTTSHTARSAGATIHFVSWNFADVHKPGLLFAHGARGNTHWWDFIAPFFCAQFRVFALDFSGMGNSDFREEYSPELFSEDLVTVIRAAGIAPATVIGHSYGGSRLLRVCGDHPALIAHAIVVDTHVHFADVDPPLDARQIGRPVPYPDYASARARFRLLPEQPCEQYLRDYIGDHALREAAGGWGWKFDPRLPSAQIETDGAAVLDRISVPLDFVCGEKSTIVPPWRAQRTVKCVRHARGPVVIPQAHHHVMLDQPLALIATLRALLAAR